MSFVFGVLALGAAACGSGASAPDGGGAAGATGAAGTTGAGGFAGRAPQVHRAAATACPTDQPATSSCNAADPSVADGGFQCRTNADCTASGNGWCVGTGSAFATTAAATSRGALAPGCHCSYDACATDADCSTGGPCACRPAAQGQAIVAPVPATGNVCLMGNCKVDADCGAGGYCSPSFGSCGSYAGVVGYYCHTARDTCVDDSDCTARGGAGDCRYNPTAGAWACSTSMCVG